MYGVKKVASSCAKCICKARKNINFCRVRTMELICTRMGAKHITGSWLIIYIFE